MKLIKELNDSLKQPDPVQEAVASVNRVYKAVEQSIEEIHEMEETELDDEQADMLADYMKEMIDASMKRGQQMPPEEAAGMALEDVAGFEAASPRVMRATRNRLVQAYTKKFGI